MPYEAFIQLLKKMFDLANYKNAPHAVVTLYSSRRLTRLTQGAADRIDPYDSSPSSDILQLC